MDRNEALKILKTYLKKDNMIKHSIASEAVLKAIAKKLDQDINKYSLAGLLHDIDVEITDENNHGLKAIEILKEHNIDNDIVEAISLHNELATKQKRTKTLDFALAAGETITGLIIATSLVLPDKKLSSVKVKSIKKRMKEKAFAASVNRETILECEKINIPIDDFFELSLNAMQSIADELGL
jgi:uncharacterized protein